MFEKLDEYLVNIYMNPDQNSDFIIFKMNNKNDYSIRGFLSSDDAYMLFRKNNQFGLKVNNDQYIFLYSREKFVDSQDFRTLVENTSEYDEDELSEKFQNVDYVVLGEHNQQTGDGQTISFLVNKSSYLVTDYFRIYEDKSSVLASYDEDLLNIDELTKLHILNPIIPSFNIAKQKKDAIVVMVSDCFHENFIIKENMKDTDDLAFRKSIVQKMSNEAVEADRRSYTIIRDFDECAKNVNKIITQRFGDDLESR